jgi:hypothetical protein
VRSHPNNVEGGGFLNLKIVAIKIPVYSSFKKYLTLV